MSAVRVAGIAAAALCAGTIGFAQTNSTQSRSDASQPVVKGTTITVVGCLMKEADYRRAHGFGKGVLNGAGLGDEYVIVDSSSGTCSETGNGAAYRPTGPHEREMKPFLGQRVEVTGKLTDNGSASIRAESGKLPPEIRVTLFAPAPPPVTEQAAAAPTPAAPAAEPAPALEAQNNATTPPAAANAPAPSTEQPVGTTGTLPKTAGEEPLIGLVGLVLVAAGLSLRLRRRATA